MKWMFKESFQNRFQAVIDKHAIWTVLITIIITLIFASFIPKLKFENNPDKFGLPNDDPVKIDRDSFESQFSPGELILIGLQFDNIINTNEVLLIRDLSLQLSKIDGIKSIKSIVDATEFEWRNKFGVNILISRPFISFKKIDDLSYVRNAVELIAQESIYKNILISEDKRSAVFILSIDPEIASQITKLITLVSEIEKLFNTEKSNNYNTYLAGTPILNIALQKAMRRDLTIFGPVSIAICILILIVLFRKWRPVVAGVLTAIMSLIWTIGMLPITQTSMSINLTMIVPVILSLSMMYSIHHLAYIFIQHSGENKSNVIICWRTKIIPAILCALTTCLGFLSLVTSRLSGIREVGIYIGLGVIISMLLSNFFLPAMLKVISWRGIPEKKHIKDTTLEKICFKIKDSVLNRSGLFVIVVSAVILLAGFGILYLKVETNHLKYLANNQEVTNSFNFIDSSFGGVLPLEILVESTNKNAPQAINDILDFEKIIRSDEEIGIVISVADFMYSMEFAKDKRRGLFKPQLYLEKNVISKEIWNKAGGVSGYGNFLIQDDSMTTIRISCRVKLSGSNKLHSLLNRVNVITEEYLSNYDVTITGLTPYFSQVEKYVMSTQIVSFGLALLVIIIVLGLLSGTLRLGLIVMLVNIVPVIFVLGIMGWMDIPLDISTVMIASITLGIVVDDTIHLIYSFRKAHDEGFPISTSLTKAFEKVGLPVVVTTLILTLSFSTLLLAEFIPTIYFGGLAALTILVAFVSDLLLLPALINRFCKSADK